MSNKVWLREIVNEVVNIQFSKLVLRVNMNRKF